MGNGGATVAVTADAVVIGGGVVGASALFHPATLGVRRAALCERRQPGAGASGASGAFIQLHFCENAAEARLTLASLPYFTDWDELVGAGSCGFVRAGYLRLEPPELAQRLRERVAMLQPLGVNTTEIAPEAARELEPTLRLTSVGAAAYEPDGGYADAQATVDGLLAAARQRGATVLTETIVTRVRVANGAVLGVETSAGLIDAPIVILAAGAWSASLLRKVGLNLPLVGALTQWIGLALPAGSRPPTLTVGDGVTQSYIRALEADASAVLVGLGGLGRRPLGDPAALAATIPTTIVAKAQDRLATLLQGARNARPIGGRSGPVKLTPDDLPIIDAHPAIGGLFFFAGDCGSSFKTAPAIGRALAEWATHGNPTVWDITAFRHDRFAPAAG